MLKRFLQTGLKRLVNASELELWRSGVSDLYYCLGGQKKQGNCFFSQRNRWLNWEEQQSRGVHSSAVVRHGHSDDDDPNAPTIGVTFVERDGSVREVRVKLGQSLLEAAHKNEIDLEGACEGSLACSTCHVIVEDQSYYDKLDEPDDDENDMLDLAFGLTETSRLGCQIKASPELDGLRVRIPSASRNIGSEVA